MALDTDVPLNATSQQASVINYIFVASVAIICYDHALTFDREIRSIWRRPWHVLPLTFLLIRYFALVFNIVRLVFLFRSLSQKECQAITLVRNIFIILVGSSLWASQIWRVSALYNYDKKFLFKIAVPFLMSMGFVFWQIPIETSMSDEFIDGCPHFESQMSIHYAKYAWLMYAVWEGIVIVLTVRSTWTSARYARGVYGRRFLSVVMFRDGVIYFVAIGGFHVANIITLFMNSRLLLRNSFLWIDICVSVTMASRFILNLRENLGSYAESLDDEGVEGGVVMSEIVFRQLGDRDEMAV